MSKAIGFSSDTPCRRCDRRVDQPRGVSGLVQRDHRHSTPGCAIAVSGAVKADLLAQTITRRFSAFGLLVGPTTTRTPLIAPRCRQMGPLPCGPTQKIPPRMVCLLFTN